MTHLAKLTFKTVDRSVKRDPIIARRDKLVAGLKEQKLVHAAALKKEDHRVERHKWMTNDMGERVMVKTHRRIRPWFFEQDGGWYVQCRYGARVIAADGTNNAVLVKSLEDVAGVLDAFLNAAAAGELDAASLGKDFEAKIMSEVNHQMFGNADKALIVINEIDEMDLRSVQPMFREFMDDKRHLVRFVATTNHKSRIIGAMLSRFRVLDLTPPTNLDWVDRTKTILEAEGLSPTKADVVQMLQSFQGSARDLIDLIEETVAASKAVV